MVKLLFLIFLLITQAFAGEKKMSHDYIGLDIRRDQELKENPANGAIHIEMSELNDETMEKLPKDKTIKVFCEAGGRAAKVKTLLESKGFTKVENIGSWREWNQLNK